MKGPVPVPGANSALFPFVGLVPFVVSVAMPITIVSPSSSPEVISVPSSPTTPVSTVTASVSPVSTSTTSTVEVPSDAVVIAAVGT